LEPQALWAHFDRILEIPRGSKEEDAARAYVVEVAEKNGLDHQVDDAGNVVVRKPGTAGHEDAPVTILQSHLDMVNEKNSDVEHDFSRDPLQPEKDGEWLTAKGTTLGADNGIGVAAMLALMEADDVAHGPLELLFTIDEETGLTGAARLDGSMLQGRRLLNLDTEEEDAVTVGCAGGGDSHLTLPVTRTDPPNDAAAVALTLKGLKGGHSGIDIHLQRGNAVRLLARIIDAGARFEDFHLADFRGGDKHNAIPREARALVVLPAGDVEGFRKDVQDEFSAVRDAFAGAEPDMQFTAEAGKVPEAVLDAASSWNALHLIHALPHGVASMSYDIPGLVETSTNLARAVLEFEALDILMSTRSSVASELEGLRSRIRAIGHLAGATVEEEEAYPGWKPNLDSLVLKVLRETFEEQRGKAPRVEAVHAGLETGIIGEKVPGMDMVSFGPQIEFPHSPDERVRIPSVAEFYRLLTSTLERLTA
ncbi:MAG: aminoacyl-histidine dipeptidase, partial [Gemmatimonadota bacterium]